MFNFTSDMLLESTNTIIGSSVSRSKLSGESNFLTGLTKVQEMQAEYDIVKAGLYDSLSESATDDFKSLFSDAYERSFPKKQDITAGTTSSLTEATDSTAAFVRYFGNSIQILNKAIGNIAGATDGIMNQIPVEKAASSKVIEACENVKSDCHCPVCGTSPCTCKGQKEKLFKYDTSRDIPFSRIDFSVVDKGIAPGTDFGKLYDSITESVKADCYAYRAKLCGLDESVEVSRYKYPKSALNSFMSSKRYDVSINKGYLDYCAETVTGIDDKVKAVKEECKLAAKYFTEAVDKLVAIKNGVSTLRYYKEDGSCEDISPDQAQDMCLAGKAKTDELIAKCADTITALSAKIDAMQSEFNQCKAVISKYSLGNDQPISLPVPSNMTDPVAPPSDGTSSPTASINEEPDDDPTNDIAPDEGCCGGVTPSEGSGEDEYDDVNDEPDDFDYDPEEPYGESLVSFAIDTILAEQQFNEYIGHILGESSDVYLTEGLIGGMKTGLQKIMQFLKNVWAKFKNSMAALFENDVKYLSDNKNIILGNKPKAVSIENWYNYDIDKINTAKLEQINANIVKLINANEASSVLKGPKGNEIRECADPKNGITNAFNKYFSAYKNDNYANTIDKFKAYYGAAKAVTINASSFDQKAMQNMYEYCYNFKDKTHKTLQDDIETVNKLYDQAIAAADALASVVPEKAEADNNASNSTGSEAKPAEQNTSAQSATQQVQATQTQYASNAQPAPGSGQNTVTSSLNSTDMASVFDQYFSESPSFGKTGTDTDTQNKDNPTKNAVNIPDKNQRDADKLADANGPAKGTIQKDAAVIKAYYENVFKVTKDFATTRMTVAESAYRDFMKFIRWHVGQYAATAKKDQQGDIIQQQPQQQQKTDTGADKIEP